MPNKYRNKKTILDGITFDSMLEAHCYNHIKLAHREPEQYGCRPIKQFLLQPKYTIIDSFTDINGKRERKILYIADFFIEYEDGTIQVVDAKGMSTTTYSIKRRLFKLKYPNIVFTEHKKNNTDFLLK